MNLAQLVQQRCDAKYPFEITELADFAQEMLDVVDFLEKRRVVHRDIKPENWMVDSTGSVYLSDFGEAVDLSIFNNQHRSRAQSTG